MAIDSNRKRLLEWMLLSGGRENSEGLAFYRHELTGV
jgi:hypothetical protein